MGSEYLFEFVETLLQLPPIASSETGFPSLLVLAGRAIAATPATGRLASIAFHLEEAEDGESGTDVCRARIECLIEREQWERTGAVIPCAACTARI